jgi:hypothetical protein
LTLEWFRPLNKHKGIARRNWEKRDREEVTAEKEATLGAAEEAVEEAMEEAAEEEGEVMAAVEAAVAAEGMIADTTATADRTEIGDRHQSKRAKKLT